MRVIILSGYGLNCENETAAAFSIAATMMSQNVDISVKHINEIIKNSSLLKECQILAIPGGFSYGDDTGSGNAFSLRLIRNLSNEIQEFLEKDKLMIGICNGCQIMARLIPEFSGITLVSNDLNRYECRWVKVKVSRNKRICWLQEIDEMYIPVAHSEGKFYFTENHDQSNLSFDNSHIALRYIDNKGEYAQCTFPYNPNGSVDDIAGLSSRDGRVFALMPHPERAVFLSQQDNWTAIKDEFFRSHNELPMYGDGLKIFNNAIKYFS